MEFSSSWNMDVEGIMFGLTSSVKRVAERTAQKVYDGVVKRSPVYSGQFRASWNISQGAPNYATADSGGSPASPLTAPKQKAKLFGPPYVLFVANGKPYAQKLEEGSSDQAPHGIMRATLASLR